MRARDWAMSAAFAVALLTGLHLVDKVAAGVTAAQVGVAR